MSKADPEREWRDSLVDNSPCVVVSRHGHRMVDVVLRALKQQIVVGTTRYSRASGKEMVSYGNRRLSQPTAAETLRINTSVLRTACIEALETGSASTVRDVAKVLGLSIPEPPMPTKPDPEGEFSLDGMVVHESCISGKFINIALSVPDGRAMPKERDRCRVAGVLVGVVGEVSKVGRLVIVWAPSSCYEILQEACVL